MVRRRISQPLCNVKCNVKNLHSAIMLTKSQHKGAAVGMSSRVCDSEQESYAIPKMTARCVLDREPLRRYGYSKLSKMAADEILNLFESKIAPLDPPSPKTPPYNQTWSGSDGRLRRYGHLNFFKMAAAAILDLFEMEIAPLDPPSPETPP